jgi:tetratricopeptide (TPR) repeat protein
MRVGLHKICSRAGYLCNITVNITVGRLEQMKLYTTDPENLRGPRRFSEYRAGHWVAAEPRCGFLSLVCILAFFVSSCEAQKSEQQIESEAHASAMEVKKAIREKNYTKAWELFSILRVEAESPEAAEIKRLKADVKEKYIAFHLNLASNLKESGSLEPALKHISKVLAIDRENPVALKLRDAINKEKSTGVKIEVEEEKPKIEKLLDLGRDQSANKKLTEAIETYQKVIRLDDRHCDGHLELGVLYARMGKIKSASKWYRKFVQICPNHQKVPQIRRVLGDFKGHD